MRILVLTSDARWANVVRTAFGREHDVMPGDPRQLAAIRTLLPVVDACFVAEAEIGDFTIDLLKQISSAGETPLFAVADQVRPEWEEAALVAGARQVFRAPLREGIVQLAVARAQRSQAVAARPVTRAPIPPSTLSGSRETRELSLLRQFSRLLSAEKNEAFYAAYLGNLREVLGCGRAFLYLRDPETATAGYKLACASGADAAQFEFFRIFADQGLGRILGLRGGAAIRDRLRSDDPEGSVALRELALFGAEVAVPLASGDGCLGILLVGPRIAGGDYSDQEVTLLYHLMEEFARAVGQPNRPATPLAAVAVERPRAVMPETLRSFPLPCAVMNPDAGVIDANHAYRAREAEFTAAGVAPLLTALFAERSRDGWLDVTQAGAPGAARWRMWARSLPMDDAEGSRWLVMLADAGGEAAPEPAAMRAETRLALEKAAEQLDLEFRQALEPLEQAERGASRLPNVQALQGLRRRVDTMRRLAGVTVAVTKETTVSAVFRAARERLNQWLEPRQLKTLVWSGEFSTASFLGDAEAVGLAVAELVMAAAEGAAGRQVTITAEDQTDTVSFKVRHPGVWASQHPFADVTQTEKPKVVVGAEVARRVAETHGGRLTSGPIANEMIESALWLPRGPVMLRGSGESIRPS